jgi:hypothetical protein
LPQTPFSFLVSLCFFRFLLGALRSILQALHHSLSLLLYRHATFDVLTIKEGERSD